MSKILCDWFLENQRDLPWRKNRDPYAIWLSEIMLQQTTVKAVLPYFERFLNEFPTVQDLAKAREEKVMSLWSGLGYYSRARNLHGAAKQVATQGFPKTYEELLKLKGVGPYTAAAVASIAFNEKVAVMDGNVMRVISRLFDISTDICEKDTQNKILKHCQDLMGENEPRIFNQAIMELGATVCIPQNPGCLVCPIHRSCQSYQKGTVSLRPVKSRKIKQEPWQWNMHVVVKKGKLAVVKNENGTPWLKNSWVLPGKARKIAAKPKDWDFKHSITKHNIFVNIQKGTRTQNKNIRWVLPKDISKLGVSSAVMKILNSKKFQSLYAGELK